MMDTSHKDKSLLENMKCSAPTVVRVALSIVFLWFGSQQLLHTSMWTSLIPQEAMSLSGMSAELLVHLNGSFEIVFGLCMLLGFFTRISALLLGLHLLGIMFTIGYNSVGVRDFGLSFATLSTFLYGPDCWSLDRYLAKKDIKPTA